MEGGAVIKVTGTYAAASRWTPCLQARLAPQDQASPLHRSLRRHRLLLGPFLPDRAPRQGQETEQALRLARHARYAKVVTVRWRWLPSDEFVSDG